MVKTIALFFVLGLMVSCASHQNDRSISSVGHQEEEPAYVERPTMGGRY